MFSFTKQKLLNDRKALGQWGEKQTEKYLKKQGMTTLTKNYSTRTGEIDLIMDDSDGTIVFVEVKTRKHEDYVKTEDVVTLPKRQRMLKTAKHFLSEYKIENKPCRFDIVVVTLNVDKDEMIRHHKHAFKP